MVDQMPEKKMLNQPKEDVVLDFEQHGTGRRNIHAKISTTHLLRRRNRRR
jgi:hypothetical protein